MLKLIIGNKNYSTWSLRPWLCMRVAGVPFAEELVHLDGPGLHARLREVSPAALVPVLVDGELRLWESLAILEHVAEKYPEANVWPREARARAEARSISAEMHAGFGRLRHALPMNFQRQFEGPPIVSPAVMRELRRMTEIWRLCREAYAGGGAFLFGEFSAADAMYAPMAARFRGYGVALDAPCEAWMDSVHQLPAFEEWRAAALQEPWSVPIEDFHELRLSQPGEAKA